jgi:hypothetical protein
MPSASAAKIATSKAHKILTHLPLNCSLHRTSHNGNALASTLLDSPAGVRVASRTAHHSSDLQDVKRDGRESPSPAHRARFGQADKIFMEGNMALTYRVWFGSVLRAYFGSGHKRPHSVFSSGANVVRADRSKRAHGPDRHRKVVRVSNRKSHCTVMVTFAVVRPNSLVASSV